MSTGTRLLAASYCGDAKIKKILTDSAAADLAIRAPKKQIGVDAGRTLLEIAALEERLRGRKGF